MSAPALAGVDRPSVTIRGTVYPVLLPRVTDPRLHLAAVFISLQVLGQVAFDFRLSIAQILVSVLTAGVIESAIAFGRGHVIMWPASALLTGNGISFILRVPGTEHGDWWSLNGWWIFAGTAAVAILGKHLIRFRGRHVFNPSNGALVLTFLLLGPEHADPLELWWAPMSPWMALALAIIVAGGIVILRRVGLLAVAMTFWLVFAAAIGVLALAGHEMTARWHLGPISGLEFWKVVVLSPEILIFLFFMITDPRTTPESRAGRRLYAVSVAVLAALLIAPFETEFRTKVALLAALVLVCALRVPWILLRERRPALLPASRPVRTFAAALGGVAVVALLVVAGIPARPSDAIAAPAVVAATLPTVTIAPSDGVATGIDQAAAARIAADLVGDLEDGSEALRTRDTTLAARGAGGAWLATLLRAIGSDQAVIPTYAIDELRLSLERVEGQGPPMVIANATGTVALAGTAAGATQASAGRISFEQTFELREQEGRYVVLRSREAAPAVLGSLDGGKAGAPPAPTGSLAAVTLTDVAPQLGLGFRQGAFRFGLDGDEVAMMGGGVCWLDFDGDGKLDLYAVNSHSEGDRARWAARGGLPRNGLFRNTGARFVDVSKGSGADLALRGNGCVSADFDGDGRTDLYVTAAGNDGLLWNEGGGRFAEGARAAGIDAWGWHTGATVGDVNGDGRPDLFVAGYTDFNAPIPGSMDGFPTDHLAVEDRLYLNVGGQGRPRFREVARAVGIEAAAVEHGLGATFTDVNRDGRLDLFVANDEDPNRLYVNEAVPDDPSGLGFRLRDVSRAAGVADPNAGMGVAASDFTGDGVGDLFVTNSRDQLHAASEGRPGRVASFADARPRFAEAFDPAHTGWGASWVDLDLDGDLELALANGGIPVTSLRMDAQTVQVLEARPRRGGAGAGFVDASAAVGLADGPLRNGRGLAAADFDDDGDVDLAVNTVGGNLLLLRTDGAAGRWLRVALGRFAPGAVVTATFTDGRRVVREVHAGSSYLSSEDPRVTFGLGRRGVLRDVAVRWPDGTVERIARPGAGRTVKVG